MRKLFLLLIFAFGTAWPQSDGYAVNADGSKTYYRTFGSGQPLLIINGGPGMNSNGFEALAKKLSENYQPIIYDQRGTGKSKLPAINSETISMQLMVSDIESLRQHLKIGKWHVLGHSFGGMLASFYAAHYPKPIEKLVLSASGGIDLGLLDYVSESTQSKLTKTQRDSLSYWYGQMADGDTTQAARLGRGRNLAPAYVHDKKFVPLLAKRLTQGNSTINNLLWDNMRKIKFNCAPKLATFTQPVLIIQGKQDIIKAETAERAHKAFKNSKVVFMDRCGHYGWLDAEEQYFLELNFFLKA